VLGAFERKAAVEKDGAASFRLPPGSHCKASVSIDSRSEDRSTN